MNWKVLSQIEFLYLPCLNAGSDLQPAAIKYILGNNPERFCSLMKAFFKPHHSTEVQKKLPEPVANRLGELILSYNIVPGTDRDNRFHEEVFRSWMDQVTKWAIANDRYEVTLNTIGNGLAYAQTDENHIVCENAIKEVLDSADFEQIRIGYEIGLNNSIEARWVDETGHTEQELAAAYNRGAEELEFQGYSRYAQLLRNIFCRSPKTVTAGY